MLSSNTFINASRFACFKSAAAFASTSIFAIACNSFLSYLLLFGVFVVIVIIAVAIGITLRKSKDTKEAAMEEILETVEPEEATADTTNE